MRLVIGFHLCVVSAHAEMQLLGVITTERHALFALRTDESHLCWLSIGDSFGGAVLTQYDSKQEVLTLLHGEKTIVLKLPESRVLASSPPNGGTPSELEVALAVALSGDEQLERMILDLCELNKVQTKLTTILRGNPYVSKSEVERRMKIFEDRKNEWREKVISVARTKLAERKVDAK